MLLSKRPEMHLPEQWPSYFDTAKGISVKDLDGNEIYLENFEYLAEENIFKSIGLIKILSLQGVIVFDITCLLYLLLI